MQASLRQPLNVAAYNLAVYRRTWRGSVIVSFFAPVLYLASMGLGLGSLVNRSAGTVGGMRYVDFVATGLLGATMMQTGMTETTYPVMGKLQWLHIYEAMLNTPVTVRNIVAGECCWQVLRFLMVAALFMVVMTVFGVLHSPLALLCIPVAVLIGLAFSTPILAFTATQRRDSAFAALNRFLVLPLFLLSGTFFPLQSLPAALQVVAWSAPLSHGVALIRSFVQGNWGGAVTLLHVAVLLLYATAGVALALKGFRRRLVV